MALNQHAPFSQFARNLVPQEKSKTFTHPLKDHPQLPLMIDALNRQQKNHLALISNAGEKINAAFADCIAQQLATTTGLLQHAYFIYFDATLFALMNMETNALPNYLLQLTEEARHNNRHIVFITSQTQDFLADHLNVLCHFLPDAHWRMVIFAEKKEVAKITELKNYFTALHLDEPSKTQQLALLKTYRVQLENFHRAALPDDVFATAYTLAEHYLPGAANFEKALELLDSAAARASAHEQTQDTGGKPVVTSKLLTQLVSSWTQIPLTHLQNNKFQANKFLAAIRKQIFGQDPAINHIAGILQNACIKLQKTHRPLCSFLFVGSSDSGKTETALAIAEQLFGHRDALLHVNLSKTHYTSLADINITPRPGQTYCTTLLEAIRAKPFAVVLIENIDLIHSEALDLFHDVLAQGFIIDKWGNKFDFHHTIFIMTTQFASEHINQLSTKAMPADKNKSVDLMQLILNDNFAEASPYAPNQFSPQELCDELSPKLSNYFPASFLQHLHIVPFVNLDYAAIEKVIRVKVKALMQRIEAQFQIEMKVAPEVIKFLAHETLWRKPGKSIEKMLELHLHSCISHEILLLAEDKNRSRHLLVQLSENGQLLRCEPVNSNESTLYSL